MKSPAIQLTQERVRELFVYDESTGALVSRASGRPIGKAGRDGHLQWGVSVTRGESKNTYYVHRLAWLYVHGKWPAHMLDHINGDPTDNRITNLREATPATNSQNVRTPTCRNTTGYLGVSKYRGGRYQAVIRVNRKPMWIGVFDDAKTAHEAYIEAKRRLHPGCTL